MHPGGGIDGSGFGSGGSGSGSGGSGSGGSGGSSGNEGNNEGDGAGGKVPLRSMTVLFALAVLGVPFHGKRALCKIEDACVAGPLLAFASSPIPQTSLSRAPHPHCNHIQ